MIISGILGEDELGSLILGAPAVPDTNQLAVVLPTSTDVWVGLFTTLPDVEGVGGVESAVSRLATSAWYTNDNTRISTDAFRFTLTADETIVGIGVWDASVGGNLLAVEPLQLNVKGNILELPLAIGEEVQVLSGALQLTWASDETVIDVSNEDYKRVMQDLLPPGPAWTREPDRVLTKLLCGMAREFSRTELQLRRLIEEADPRTTQELLPDWERFLDLPGECTNPPTTLEGRRQAVLAKLRQRVSPTPEYFKTLAEDLGYTGVVVTTNEGNPFTTISNCNDSLRGGPWLYTWSIQTDQSSDQDDTLDCLVSLVAPAHGTYILYLGTTPI